MCFANCLRKQRTRGQGSVLPHPEKKVSKVERRLAGPQNDAVIDDDYALWRCLPTGGPSGEA